MFKVILDLLQLGDSRWIWPSEFSKLFLEEMV